MNPIFYHLFYRPILNLLVFFVHYLPGHDLGLAILFLTLFIKLLLHPLTLKSLKDQKRMAELQPKIKEIQKKYNKDSEKLTQETLKLFQEEKINPFLGFFLLFFIQLPVLSALFFILKNLNNLNFNDLYFFTPKITKINPFSLGFLDLSKSFLTFTGGKTIYYWPALPLLFLSLLAYFFQTKIQQKESNAPSQRLQENTFYFLFGITSIFLIFFPSAIAFYWLVISIFSLIEQRSVFKIQKNG